MLRIGDNHYDLIQVHSGFSVNLHDRAGGPHGREQLWELKAHYVPRDGQYTPRGDGAPEYLVVNLQDVKLSLPDWRKLTDFGTIAGTDEWDEGWESVQNLLVGLADKESWSLYTDWIEVEARGDYLFRCRFAGQLRRDKDTVEEVEFEDEFPFREAVVQVPVNATDPTATARRMATQSIRMTEFAATKLRPYDPQKRSFHIIKLNTHHVVTLTTPWRNQPG